MTAVQQLDLTLIRILLALADGGSISQAAAALGIGRLTVKRRLSELEAAAGTPLLVRGPGGVTLTRAGERVATSAAGVSRAADTFLRTLRSLADVDTPVTVSSPEGVRTYLIGPRAAGLDCPSIPLSVSPSGALPPLNFVDYGMPAQVEIIPVEPGGTVPRPSEYRTRRIGTMKFRPVAARSYLAANGVPDDFTAVARCRLLNHTAYDVHPSFRVWADMAHSRSAPVFTAPSSSTLHRALLGGGGISLLPDFSSLIDHQVVVLPVGEPMHVDLWATAHPEELRIPSVRRTYDAIVAMFDRSPWFASA